MSIAIIPPELAAVARGRDHIQTAEMGRAISLSPQTIRKLHCVQGAVYGIRPVKIGGRLLWPVIEVAKLLNGGVQ